MMLSLRVPERPHLALLTGFPIANGTYTPALASPLPLLLLLLLPLLLLLLLPLLLLLLLL